MTEEFDDYEPGDPYAPPESYCNSDEYLGTEFEPNTEAFRASKFSIGDVVVFNGGGKVPVNVINVNRKRPVVLVAWFNNGEILDAILPEACLQKIDFNTKVYHECRTSR